MRNLLKPQPVYAEITNPVIGNLGNDADAAAQGTTFVSYFITIWQAIITIGGLMVLLYLIWGAIEWITAGGDSGKIQKARDKMTQAVIGLVVLVATFAIVELVNTLFFGGQFDILELNFISP